MALRLIEFWLVVRQVCEQRTAQIYMLVSIIIYPKDKCICIYDILYIKTSVHHLIFKLNYDEQKFS